MRADARSLLDRLGRSDFAYKEFADRFSDLELWPLFEALLKDPRLFQQDLASVSAAEAVTAPSIAGARLAEPAERGPASGGSETLADLFRRYEGDPAAPPAQQQGHDVRAMLRRLSDLGDRGEL
jgi:hypothetical protein